MKAQVFLSVAAVAWGLLTLAHATTLTFDDIGAPLTSEAIHDGYGGFSWSHFRYLDGGETQPGSGYDTGTVSGDYAAFNSGALGALVAGDVFDFVGVYLTAAWVPDLNISVSGYRGADLLYTSTVVVDTRGAGWFEFGYLGIDRLEFSSFAVTASSLGTHFVMDDFTFQRESGGEPVPEPATLLLFGSGLAGLWGLRRRSVT